MDRDRLGSTGRQLIASLMALAMAAVGACSMAVFPPSVSAGVPGSLDPTFGARGLTAVSPDMWIMGPSGIAEGPDGSMVMTIMPVKRNAGQVVKFTSRGGIDRAFGTNGSATLRFSSGSMVPRDVLVDRRGRTILAGGGRLFGSEGYGAAFARLTPDGRPDLSFAGDGLQVSDPERFGTPTGMTFSSNGSVLTVATARGRAAKTEVVRYTESGDLDRSFSGDGVKLITIRNPLLEREIATDNKGRIVLAAAAGIDERGNGPVAYRVDRLTADGRHDRSFSSDGKLVRRPVPDVGSVLDLTVDNRDRALVSGSGESGSVIARFETNGKLDAAFGDGGFAAIEGIGANSISVDDSGRINLIGEWGASYFGSWSRVVRLRNNGRPDRSFEYKSGQMLFLSDHFLDWKNRIVAMGMADGIGPGVVRILNP